MAGTAQPESPVEKRVRRRVAAHAGEPRGQMPQLRLAADPAPTRLGDPAKQRQNVAYRPDRGIGETVRLAELAHPGWGKPGPQPAPAPLPVVQPLGRATEYPLVGLCRRLVPGRRREYRPVAYQSLSKQDP